MVLRWRPEGSRQDSDHMGPCAFLAHIVEAALLLLSTFFFLLFGPLRCEGNQFCTGLDIKGGTLLGGI